MSWQAWSGLGLAPIFCLNVYWGYFDDPSSSSRVEAPYWVFKYSSFCWSPLPEYIKRTKGAKGIKIITPRGKIVGRFCRQNRNPFPFSLFLFSHSLIFSSNPFGGSCTTMQKVAIEQRKEPLTMTNIAATFYSKSTIESKIHPSI